jgi:hypothetical protein
MSAARKAKKAATRHEYWWDIARATFAVRNSRGAAWFICPCHGRWFASDSWAGLLRHG